MESGDVMHHQKELQFDAERNVGLTIAQVREGNSSGRCLAWHPGVLLGNSISLQGLFPDASACKVLHQLWTEGLKLADVGLANLNAVLLLAPGHCCKQQTVSAS